MSEAPAAPAPKKERLDSLDAFRGLTIFLMVLVIAIAAGQYHKEMYYAAAAGKSELRQVLPQTTEWFGSMPISTWFHADVGYDLWEEREVERLKARGIVLEPEIEAAIADRPESKLKGIGVTITDLVAPWFVFIVGACVPLSRGKRGGDWWLHVLSRTFILILMGMIYISLVIKQVTWWWGVLQAIGVAYFCAAALCRLPEGWPRWMAVFAVGAANMLATQLVPWWTTAWENVSDPFMTLTNPTGHPWKPLIVHCQPWLSVSYGVMAMIGVLVGETLTSRNHSLILGRCALVGGVFTLIGLAIHIVGFQSENFQLCMNKPDVTTSYAFFTTGLGALCFGLFYWVIDVAKIKTWAMPLNVFGANSLLAYFLMIIMRRAFDSLGVVELFNRVSNDPTQVVTNPLVKNWAVFFGSADKPATWVYDIFAKGGYHGLVWGLLWTACLWWIVLWCNKRNYYWKL